MPFFKSARRPALVAGLAAAALSWATAGQAAVVYDFRWFENDDPEAAQLGAFTFTAADFITGQIDVGPDDLGSCAVGMPMSSCATQTLDEDSTAHGEDGYDVVVFRYDQMIASRGVPTAARTSVHFFEDGALQTAGVHEQILSDYISRLTVTVVPNAVPEPATWALMLLGFGVAGGALRFRPRMVV